MLKTEMVNKLNEQLNLEAFSSNLYLQMSAWCSNNAFVGAAKFFREHAAEESEHMMRLFNYLDGTGAQPIIGSIESPEHAFSSLKDVIEKAYTHEQHITECINELVDEALQRKDYPTFNFLQWYVAEQHEEEKLFKDMIDRILLVGNSGEGLFLVDKEFGNTPTDTSN